MLLFLSIAHYCFNQLFQQGNNKVALNSSHTESSVWTVDLPFYLEAILWYSWNYFTEYFHVMDTI